MPKPRRATFEATLDRIDGKGGWTYVSVPAALTPRTDRPWGRIPIRATMGNRTWDTSLWRTKTGAGFLPVPRKVRGALEQGARVQMAFEVLDEE